MPGRLRATPSAAPDQADCASNPPETSIIGANRHSSPSPTPPLHSSLNTTGELSISEVPPGLAPAALPGLLEPTLLITVQPAGVRFLIPVPITFPNVDGLPPGEEVDIWSLDPELGEFAIVGTGQVSADGSRIETVSGGIRAADWHAAMPPQLLSSNRSKRTDPNNPCPQCGEKKGSSTFSLNDGHMGTRFTLPAYRSLEASRALTFNYRTFRAFPRPVIEAGGVVART